MNIGETKGDPQYTYDEFADKDIPMLCNKCGHNSWREDFEDGLYCVPCMNREPITQAKAIELTNLLRRR